MGEEWKCTMMNYEYVYTKGHDSIRAEEVCDELNRQLNECIELRIQNARLKDENARLRHAMAGAMELCAAKDWNEAFNALGDALENKEGA